MSRARVDRVCCSAGRQADPLSTGRQHALRRTALEDSLSQHHLGEASSSLASIHVYRASRLSRMNVMFCMLSHVMSSGMVTDSDLNGQSAFLAKGARQRPQTAAVVTVLDLVEVHRDPLDARR